MSRLRGRVDDKVERNPSAARNGVDADWVGDFVENAVWRSPAAAHDDMPAVWRLKIRR